MLTTAQAGAQLTTETEVPPQAQTNDVVSSTQELKRLSLEELMNQDVTMVSRRPERWFTSPSAIQVVTGEDIWRSGASRLPEALRLAPNLQVAQVDSSAWVISARGFSRGSGLGSGSGFNFGTANKLQVLIDGRSVYTPLFAGVIWDVQNVMLEDVDRIEVISGPGGVLWGANAVNGIINVISKSAKDTQGTLISGGGGTQLRDFGTLRYGDAIGTNVYFRLYGTYFDRNSTLLPNGESAFNDWRLGQGGFRMDWLPPEGDIITLQSDGYRGSLDQPVLSPNQVDGQNVLSRWTHPLSDDSDFVVQSYWDRTFRNIPGVGAERLNTYDLDFQHRLLLGERHQFIWGAGYRLIDDDFQNTRVIAFYPPNPNLQLFSLFAQDEIALVPDRVHLTLGSRLEHNDYSGFEVQPNVRLAWTPNERHTLWGAISRAVRSPSRIDRDIVLEVPPVTLLGSSASDSEKMLAYELGYRIRPTSRLVLSLATFYQDYDDVHSVQPELANPRTLVFGSGLRANSWGTELSGTYQVTREWRLRGGYTYFDKVVWEKPGVIDVSQGRAEGNDPQNQFLLQSMLDLPHHIEFDLTARYVDTLPSPNVPSYFTFDARLAWKPRKNLELAVVGQNLWDDQHPEFGDPLTRQEIPRSVYGKLTWWF